MAAPALDAQQLQQIIRDATAAAARASQPGMKVPAFSSGAAEDWLTWRSNFLLAAQINGWNNKRQRRQIAASMEGTAKRRVASIPIEDGNVGGGNDAADPAGLLDAYEAIFVVAADSDMARSSFKTARQGPEETVLDWHARLRSMYKRAMPTLTDAQIEASQELREQFLLYLRNRRVGQEVWRTRPANYQQAHDRVSDALAAAALWDSAWGGSGRGGGAINALGEEGWDPAVGSLRPRGGHSGRGGYPTGRQRSGHFSGGSGCFECGGNHLARHCAERTRRFREERRGAGGQRGGSGGGSGWGRRGRGSSGRGGRGRGRGSHAGAFQRYIAALTELQSLQGLGGSEQPSQGPDDDLPFPSLESDRGASGSGNE